MAPPPLPPGRAPPLGTAGLLLMTLLATVVAAPDTSSAPAEGWSLKRMEAEYGDSARRSLPTWSVPRPDDAEDVSNATSRSPWGERSASWLGGVSQYYGAGGVSPIDSSTGVLTPRFNAMVPGFGESGARSLHPRPGTALDDAALRARNALLNKVETTLWAAAILRDNMVTVFGYVLNLPGNPLDPDLYAALYHIYEEVRFRRFQTVPLVETLGKICRESPTSQFTILFRSMKDVARPYMTSAIEFWLMALEDDVIDVDEWLRPKGGPLVVDFLEGIDPSVLKLLSNPPKFPSSTEEKADLEVKFVMGSVVANTFAAITDGTLPLTQTLFALLLQTRPTEMVVPEKMESERYISDSLRLRKIKSWRTIAKQAESDRGHGNYNYMRAILWALSESTDVESSLQEAARLVHSFIKPLPNTFSNPEYNYTSYIMSHPTIDILHILKAITPSEYPEDVVDAKNRLTYYVEAGYLDMEFVVKGFNRFDHVQPINLVIAILQRIEMRLPKLPHELRSSVKYLKVYLIFKKFLCSLSPQIPKDFLDAPFLLDSFEGPKIPRKIRTLVKKLEQHLRKERLPVEKLISETPVAECSRPRQCILNMYRRIVKHGYISGLCKDLMVSLITKLDIDGEPISPPQQPKFKVKSKKLRKCSKYRNRWKHESTSSPKPISTPSTITTPKVIPSTTKSTTLKPTTTTISNLVTTTFRFPTRSRHTTTPRITPRITTTLTPTTRRTKTSQSWEYLNITTVTYMNVTTVIGEIDDDESENEDEDCDFYPGAPEPPILFPLFKDFELIQKPNYMAPATLLPPTELATVEDTKIRPIREFLILPNLYSMLGYSFRPEAYPTKLQLLIVILKRGLNLSIVKFNPLLRNTMKEYLAILQNLPRRPQILFQYVFPNVTDDYENQTPNYEEPYKNLPTCTTGSRECDKLHPIRQFLMDENIYYKLGPYFQPSLYHTKAQFIKGILQHAIHLKIVQRNVLLYKSIKEFLSYLNEAHIEPGEVKTTPFPSRDPIKDHEPPNWKYPLTLLPKTVPGTPEHIKLRPIREFCSRPDFWNIMGTDFKPYIFKTKGELIRAILSHAINLKWVKAKAKLHDVLRQYYSFLETSMQNVPVPVISINLGTLLKALPYPKTTVEELRLRRIKELFQNPLFFAACAPALAAVQAKLRTRGAALQMVIQQALEKQNVYQPDEPTVDALQYFKDKIILDGFGAQAVDYLVRKKKKDEIKFSVLDLFRAIDHNLLKQSDRLRVKRVIRFVSKKFNPLKYLKGFKFRKITTKGAFLKAAFNHMCNLTFIRSKIKSDLQFLTNYIMKTGPGAEKINVQLGNVE